MVEAIRAVWLTLKWGSSFQKTGLCSVKENKKKMKVFQIMDGQIKKTITDTPDWKKPRETPRKWAVWSCKGGKQTKVRRDNWGHWSIRANTLLQIRFLLACCSLKLAFVVKALICHCVDSPLIVDPTQILCNPTQSVYTRQTTTLRHVLHTLQQSIPSPKLQPLLRNTL